MSIVFLLLGSCLAPPPDASSTGLAETGLAVSCTDSDGDGYGVGDDLSACEEAEPDCDDSNPSIFPGADEYCNGVDDDCDDSVDEPDAMDAVTWFADRDSDGFGNASDSTNACSPPSGYVGDSTDCDDSAPLVNPLAEELCLDGKDNDCDGEVDGCEFSLGSADAILTGEVEHDSAGYSVSGAGDVDGDGIDDILLGANGVDTANSEAGAAYLVLGSITGVLSLAEAGAKLLGEETYDRAGLSVSGAGDVNADGYADLLVGSDLHDDNGTAYLVLGPVSGESSLSGYFSLSGTYADDHAGWAVSGAADVNADGFDDVLVGAFGNDSGGVDAGAAYVVLGPISHSMSLENADASIVGEESGDRLGFTLSDAGDLDGDGFHDIILGAYQHDSSSGAAYVFRGPVSGYRDASSADATMLGETPYDDAGYSVSGAGDVNGDGLDDVLVGATGVSTSVQGAGAAYLVLGPATASEFSLAYAQARILGENQYEPAGFSVSGAGDVDGDELDDVLLGLPDSSLAGRESGAAYLVYGPITGDIPLSRADARMLGEAPDDNAGISVSGAGDTNADGLDDLLIGAYGENTHSLGAGAVYLLLGGH